MLLTLFCKQIQKHCLALDRLYRFCYRILTPGVEHIQRSLFCVFFLHQFADSEFTSILFHCAFVIVDLPFNMISVLGISLALVALYFLRFHYDFIRAFVMSLKVDGPPAYPIIGNGLIFFNKSAAGNSQFISE